MYKSETFCKKSQKSKTFCKKGIPNVSQMCYDSKILFFLENSLTLTNVTSKVKLVNIIWREKL